MAIVTNNTDSKIVPLKEVVRQNFKERKFDIMLPSIKGISAMIGTILVLTTNPYGWTFSASTLVMGIIFAVLSAIASIGYSIYLLMQRAVQIKNTVVVE